MVRSGTVTSDRYTNVFEVFNQKQVEEDNGIDLLLADHTPDYPQTSVENLKEESNMKFWVAPALENACQQSGDNTSPSEILSTVDQTIKDFSKASLGMS